MIFLASDNWAGAHPKIAAGLSHHAAGFAEAYGASRLDRAVAERFNAMFEREVAVFFVATGTAANALALTAAARPGGVAFAHREAHVLEDECGASEYLSGGCRVQPIDGDLGRIDPARLRHALARLGTDNLHAGQPTAVTVTQATEAGTVYPLAAIAEIGEIARSHGLVFHMDGARFANALVALEATPAEMTWKRGVDIMSFGGTKNGCWCAEAVVLFDPGRARDFGFLRKRAAQLFSKSRFVAAQFEAYFADGLWLELAAHANAMAGRLAGRIAASNALRLAWQPEANEVFAVMNRELFGRLKREAIFYPWAVPHASAGEIGPDETLCRLVTSFATTAADIDGFAALFR